VDEKRDRDGRGVLFAVVSEGVVGRGVLGEGGLGDEWGADKKEGAGGGEGGGEGRGSGVSTKVGG